MKIVWDDETEKRLAKKAKQKKIAIGAAVVVATVGLGAFVATTVSVKPGNATPDATVSGEATTTEESTAEETTESSKKVVSKEDIDGSKAETTTESATTEEKATSSKKPNTVNASIGKALTIANESVKAPVSSEKAIEATKYFKEGLDTGVKDIDEIKSSATDEQLAMDEVYLQAFNLIAGINNFYEGASLTSEDIVKYIAGVCKAAYEGKDMVDEELKFGLTPIDGEVDYNASDYLYYLRYFMEKFTWDPANNMPTAAIFCDEMSAITVDEFLSKTNRSVDINEMPLTAAIQLITEGKLTEEDLSSSKSVIPIFTKGFTYGDEVSSYALPVYDSEDHTMYLTIFNADHKLLDIKEVGSK